MTSGSPQQAQDDKPDRLFILSVGKCFQLLECLNGAQRPLTMTELVQLSTLDKSTVQRLTHTLLKLGYLRQQQKTRAYTLSSRMLEFGHTVLATDSVREIADPHLQRLNQQTGETVNLMELEGSEIVSRYPSLHPVSVNLHVGSRLPAVSSAAGRAILAHLPQARSDAILAGPRPQMTPHTITDLPRLQDILGRVRADGFVLNDQEAFIGDISLAAPIMNVDREVVGAINIAVPVPRWTAARARHELAPLVVQCAQAISRDLATRPGPIAER